ncbi:MAG: alpha/beta hydrolase-fold protein [Erysipelotrichaceae bacterium]|nr:alpha/beta hydrolase-fold protein [Erysipelotrichaceae bacterium]
MIEMNITMRSTVLEIDTKVTVLLPEDRHKTEDLRGKKYPVLYILHGMKEDSSSWLHLSNIFLLCRDLDLIVVMPSGNNSMYVNQEKGLDYYTYIAEELPMKLKNFLPITDDVDKTFIMGESMGGYGTMRLALGSPEKYGKAVCLSGGNIVGKISNRQSELAFGEDKDYVVNSDNNLYVIMERLSGYEGHIPDFKIYCGMQDFVYDMSVELCDKMNEYLPEHFKGGEFSDGEHNFFYWNRVLPDALRFFGFDVKENSVI